MWLELALAILVGCAFVLVPGYFFLRAARVSRIDSVCMAPIVTLVLTGVLTIVYSKLGVFSSWLTVYAPLVAVGVVAAGVSKLVNYNRRANHVFTQKASKVQWLQLLAYVGVACVATLFVYVWNLEAADSFSQASDNVHHIGQIYTFVLTGDWSALTVTSYPQGAGAEISPVASAGGYYPSAWHIVAASIVSALDVPVTLSINAANCVFIVAVYAPSMFMLMSTLFAQHAQRRVVWFGALFTVAFAWFPWGLLVFGPLYSNMAAFSMLPAMVAIFVRIVLPEAREASGIGVARGVALFVVALVAAYFAQPNAVFAAGAVLIPFCVWRVALAGGGLAPFAKTPRRMWAGRILFAAGACVVFAILWCVAYKMPFMQGVVQFNWEASETTVQAIANMAALSAPAWWLGGTQIVLAVVVFIGVLTVCFDKRYLWVACAYAFFLAAYVVCASTEGRLKHVMGGFWYTDTWRLVAAAAIVGVPLASIGFAKVCDALALISKKPSLLPTLVLTGAFVALNFAPAYDLRGFGEMTSTFEVTYHNIAGIYSKDGTDVTADERDFLDQVKQVVPDGALIVNSPFDGSAYMYGIDGLNLYYRSLTAQDSTSETFDSRLIRLALSSISDRESVRAAVDELGAQYVLILDSQDEYAESSSYIYGYYPQCWVGIEGITDTTPGFEVVLAQDDMRLYRIL
jgi:hypothetical protein